MSSKQSSHSTKSKRGYRPSEKHRDKDWDRERESDGRGRAAQHPKDRQPRRRPSVSPSRPKNEDPPKKPPPSQPPPPQPTPSSSADPSDTKEEWVSRSDARDENLWGPDFSQSEEQMSAEPAQWAQIEVLGEQVAAIFDYNIDNNFVSESFAARLRIDGQPVEAHKTSQSKAYYNTPPTKKTIKTSIKFLGTGGVLKDETLYIVKGDILDQKVIVLCKKVGEAYERKQKSVAAGSQPLYPQSPHPLPSHFAMASSAVRPHYQAVYEDTNQSGPLSYDPRERYTFGVQDPQVDSSGGSEVYYQPASLGDRGGYSPQPEQDPAFDPSRQGYLSEHGRGDAQQPEYEYEKEYDYSTSATPTE